MIKETIKKLFPKFILDWYYFLLAFLAVLIYRFPSRKLKVIGVTGTNGKSTTVELISKVLEQAGYQTAFLSSIKLKIKDKEKENMFKMTMPGRFEIHKFLRQALTAGCQYVVLEVTSEGIRQHRHCFIRFEAAVFTNLTPEHIESHGGFENYRKAKGKLFQAAKKIHIINIDDENAQYFLNFPANQKYSYGMLKGDVNNQELNLKLQLIGDFNIYNALAAICLGKSQNIDLLTAKQAVEKVKGIPGRMEEVVSQPFKVLIDYAVTPDALERLYKSVKTIYHPQRIIAVFGSCGGGRDKWRRPALAQIAAKYCQKIIITNEDPYDEDPNQILLDIKAGLSKTCFPLNDFYEILDRRQAIRKALLLAEKNDLIVITGKGSEPWICLAKGKKMPWKDKKIVLEEFQSIKTK